MGHQGTGVVDALSLEFLLQILLQPVLGRPVQSATQKDMFCLASSSFSDISQNVQTLLRSCSWIAYLICSVICFSTLCRREATRSITSASFSSSLSTSSWSHSEGRRFLQDAEQKKENLTLKVVFFKRRLTSRRKWRRKVVLQY